MVIPLAANQDLTPMLHGVSSKTPHIGCHKCSPYVTINSNFNYSQLSNLKNQLPTASTVGAYHHKILLKKFTRSAHLVYF